MARAEIKIKQFSKCQYDYADGDFACTAIAMVAGAEFMRKRGNTRKCLWNDEKVSSVIGRGVQLYNAWAEQHAGGDSKTLAAADEIAQHSVLSTLLDVQDCVFGQYICDAIGLTLQEAVQKMVASASPANSKAGVGAYVFTTQAHSTFIGVKRVPSYEDPNVPYEYRFVVFDSHTRDKATGMYIKNGKAVTVRLASPRHLLGYLFRLYDCRAKPQEAFTLHHIKLTSKEAGESLREDSIAEVLRPAEKPVEGQSVVDDKFGNTTFAKLYRSTSSGDSMYESSASDLSPATTPPVSRLARQFSRLASFARRTSMPGC